MIKKNDVVIVESIDKAGKVIAIDDQGEYQLALVEFPGGSLTMWYDVNKLRVC